jgi:hypothetical protein
VGNPVKIKVVFSPLTRPKSVVDQCHVLFHYAIAVGAITRPHESCAAFFPQR